jgi:hypothetical protein
MEVRRWLFDTSCAVHSFLVKTVGPQAQMHLKISRGDNK